MAGSEEIVTFEGERTTEIHPDLQDLHFINIYMKMMGESEV